MIIFKKIVSPMLCLFLLLAPCQAFAEPVTPTATPTPTSTPSPTPTSTPKPTPSPTATPVINSSYLASLKVDSLDFDQAFTRTTKKYTVTVPADTKIVNIVATPDNNSVILKGTGKQTLKDGKNEFSVITKLKDTNDKETIYTIVITREVPDVTLSSLKVTGYALKEAFKSNIYEYTLEVPNEITSINVIAKASNSNASVSTTNANNLEEGENKVLVTVTYSTGTKQVYKILVTRALKDKENVIPITSDNKTSDNKNEPVITPPKDNKEESSTFKYILISVGCFLLLAVAGLGIYFYLKSGSSSKAKRRALNQTKEDNKVNQTEDPLLDEDIEIPDEISLVDEDEEDLLDATKEAPKISRSDILDGIEDLFEEDNK
ncbi:MAG: cadherin-like beta sandwich domain-containing protein [Bacilli bacterium]